MMISKHSVLAAGAALALVCGVAVAEDQTMKENWKSLDANGDGKVTMTENRANADQAFKKVDADGDGTVSQTEYMAAMKDMEQH
ncbi:MAG: RNA polymerase subunit sigma-70 [Panacagrimonas sp.]